MGTTIEADGGAVKCLVVTLQDVLKLGLDRNDYVVYVSPAFVAPVLRFFIMSTVRTLCFLPMALIVPALAVAGMLGSSGCETVRESGIPGLRPDTTKKYEANREEQEHRDNFVVHRDHQSLYWLVANRVKNGMSLMDVEQILGEPGERETDTSRLKLGGLYQSTDTVYKWGPDSDGYSVVFVFRDNHLVNFDPASFRSS